MEKGKRLKTVHGETLLPEVMIQHIQSFMSGKDAARTTILSKSWYTAWSTRPTLDFNPSDFRKSNRYDRYDFRKLNGFEEYAMKILQRYQDSNLKIDSFRLRDTFISGIVTGPVAKKLIVKAIKLGATDLNLELGTNRSLLPREVLESETLVRLSVSRRRIDGPVVRCWRLKSLVFDQVHMRSDNMFRDIISCCKLLEELSITDTNNKKFSLSVVNLFELHKLRHLYLKRVVVDPLFFTNFASRFPCLKNLSLVYCAGTYSKIQISSTSLERITIKVSKYGKASTVELDVPNLVYFSYSGDKDIPILRIQSSREWESDIYLWPGGAHQPRSFYFRMESLLSQLSPSKNSAVCLYVGQSRYQGRVLYGGQSRSQEIRVCDEEGVIKAVSEPLALQNLTIYAPFASSYTLLVGLFKICRPKNLKIFWSRWDCDRSDEFIGSSILCKRLMKEKISPNCGIPDQDIFGQIGLKEVSVDVYKQSRETKEWEALPLNQGLDALTAPRFEEMFFLFTLRWG